MCNKSLSWCLELYDLFVPLRPAQGDLTLREEVVMWTFLVIHSGNIFELLFLFQELGLVYTV